MSEAGAGGREWRFYLDDMLDFAGKVMSYTASLDQAGFVADDRTYDATLRNLELIGEAATRIPETSTPLTRKSPGARSSPRAIALSMPTSASTTTRSGA
jgi:hypothetical protein